MGGRVARVATRGGADDESCDRRLDDVLCAHGGWSPLHDSCHRRKRLRFVADDASCRRVLSQRSGTREASRRAVALHHAAAATAVRRTCRHHVSIELLSHRRAHRGQRARAAHLRHAAVHVGAQMAFATRSRSTGAGAPLDMHAERPMGVIKKSAVRATPLSSRSHAARLAIAHADPADRRAPW
jgi:hypothetical protein